MMKIIAFLTNKIIQRIRRIFEYIYEQNLNKTSFAIVSNNCWGFKIYKTLSRPYNTPFIGLYLEPDSYLCFIKHLELNLQKPLCFSLRHELDFGYPVAYIDDEIIIHFLHYKNKEEALSKWTRRSARLLEYINQKKGPVYIKMCDREGASANHISTFHSFDRNHFKLVSFSYCNVDSTSNISITDEIEFTRKGPQVNQHLYDNRYLYFDFVAFLKHGVVTTSFFCKLIRALHYSTFKNY